MSEVVEVFEYTERDGLPLEFMIGQDYLRGTQRYRPVRIVRSTRVPGQVVVEAVPVLQEPLPADAAYGA